MYAPKNRALNTGSKLRALREKQTIPQSMLTPSLQQLSEPDNKKISENTEDLSNTIHYRDLIDISKILRNQQQQNTYF